MEANASRGLWKRLIAVVKLHRMVSIWNLCTDADSEMCVGRHPYLRPEEPDSAAQNYVTDDLRCFCNAVPSA